MYYNIFCSKNLVSIFSAWFKLLFVFKPYTFHVKTDSLIILKSQLFIIYKYEIPNRLPLNFQSDFSDQIILEIIFFFEYQNETINTKRTNFSTPKYLSSYNL